MKNKNIRLGILAALVIIVAITSCKKSFLSVTPQGVLQDAQVATPKGVREALVGAYSDLDGQYNPTGFNFYAQPDNWLYGSICGGDAHKGSDPGDQAIAMAIATFQGLPNNDYFETKWEWVYDGIARCNLVLRLVNNVGLAEDEAKNIEAQAHFLRGYFAFEARKTWKMVPWVDTAVTYVANNYQVPNDKDIFPQIEAEFQTAYQNLPATQDAIGRANKWAAAAFLAKVYMFEKKYTDALPLLNDIISKGETSDGKPYALQDKFSNNFNFAYNNSSESVFAIQSSLNDGAQAYHGNIGDLLNYPYGNGAVTGCCGFFQPSIELVNSFRTDANGLPLLDGSYDNDANAVKNDQGIPSDKPFTPDKGNLDPRVDWTAGRRGIPYLDWGIDPGNDWIRNQASAGPYSPKKNVFYKSQIGSGGDNSQTQWAPANAINYNLIRFAQVLLWAAECEVEVGSLANAEEDVNKIRNRAANTDDFVITTDSLPAAHYLINPYPTGWFAAKGKDMARKAVHFEEKLELAMEGHRFFDLVRWGDAATEINHYFQYEQQFTTDIKGAKFSDPTNEYFPIPQTQIDLSGGTLKQNDGYH